MFVWFGALAIAGVYVVFRDPAIDYRLIALGALLPDPIDALIRQGIGPAHSVVTAVIVLFAVMLATIGRRGLRRRALAIPIGIFAHLTLDGAWSTTGTFWWPLAGRVAKQRLPFVAHGVVVVALQELIGIGVGVWLYRTFRLSKPALRAQFVKTGRIHRDLR